MRIKANLLLHIGLHKSNFDGCLCLKTQPAVVEQRQSQAWIKEEVDAINFVMTKRR